MAITKGDSRIATGSYGLFVGLAYCQERWSNIDSNMYRNEDSRSYLFLSARRRSNDGSFYPELDGLRQDSLFERVFFLQDFPTRLTLLVIIFQPDISGYPPPLTFYIISYFR